MTNPTERLEEIKAALAAATPGPWPEDCVYGAIRHIARNVDHDAYCADVDTGCAFSWERSGKDSHLIAHAPEWLAWLIEQVEAAQRELALYKPTMSIEIGGTKP